LALESRSYVESRFGFWVIGRKSAAAKALPVCEMDGREGESRWMVAAERIPKTHPLQRADWRGGDFEAARASRPPTP
jgi:hypothetical protein